jgi:hypothetical protein
LTAIGHRQDRAWSAQAHHGHGTGRATRSRAA